MAKDRDYVLGTHEQELARLGLQHQVWRGVALECWTRAGIGTGHRVLDVGAGPGYASVDLAQIVGPSGEVIALERSANFVNAMRKTCADHGLTNVQIHERDLMTGEFPKVECDFSWCRWVASFVSDPALLVQRIGGALKKGGSAIFHEYAHYETWKFFPPLKHQEKFREHVIATWHESGGEPNGARDLPAHLSANGFKIRSATPQIFCLRPNDPMWQWPATFIDVYLPRLEEMGQIDRPFADNVRADLASAERNPNALMITPLVLEIIAQKT